LAGHAPKGEPSSVHWNVLPASDAVNVNAADVLATVPDGPEVIVVVGATVSTIHVRAAGVWSMLPAASTARTSKLFAPGARPVWPAGHAPNAAPSRLH